MRYVPLTMLLLAANCALPSPAVEPRHGAWDAPSRKSPIELRLYDVQDLTYGIQDFPGVDVSVTQDSLGKTFGTDEEGGTQQFTGEDLATLIQNGIDKDGWDSNNKAIQFQNGLLIVRNTRAVHDEIAAYLTALRRSATSKYFVEVALLGVAEQDPAGLPPTGVMSAAQLEAFWKGRSGSIRAAASLAGMNTQRLSSTAGAPDRRDGQKGDYLLGVDVRGIRRSGSGLFLEARIDAMTSDASWRASMRSTLMLAERGGACVALGEASGTLHYLVISGRTEGEAGGRRVDIDASAESRLALFDIRDMLVRIQDFAVSKVSYPTAATEPDRSGTVGGVTFTLEEPKEASVGQEQIVDFIKANVAPGSWEEGDYTMDLTLNNQLLVNQKSAVLDEIEKLLEQIGSIGSEVLTTRLTVQEVDEQTLEKLKEAMGGRGLCASFGKEATAQVLAALKGARLVEDIAVSGMNTQRMHVRSIEPSSHKNPWKGWGSVLDVRPIRSGEDVVIELRVDVWKPVPGVPREQAFRGASWRMTIPVPIEGGLILAGSPMPGADRRWLVTLVRCSSMR